MRYATALADYAEAGGYEQRGRLGHCMTAALGIPFDARKWRELATAVGRRAEAARARGAAARSGRGAAARRARQLPRCAGQAWLEAQLRARRRRVLLVSHDRELLAAPPTASSRSSSARRATPPGCTAAASRPTTQPATSAFERLDELRRRWDEQHAKLKRARCRRTREGRRTTTTWRRATRPRETRLAKFEEAGPPEERPPAQTLPHAAARRPHRQARRRVRGPRAHRAHEAVRPRGLVRRPRRGARLERLGQVALPAPARRRRHRSRRRTRPTVGDAARPVAHTGRACWARGSCPGWFAQTHEHPEFARPHAARHPAPRRREPRRACRAMPPVGARPLRARTAAPSSGSRRSRAASRPASRSCCSSSRGRPCCCSTSRPTTSTSSRPRRSRTALARFEGTVLAVTHDRWFARSFDRFLVFGADGKVRETDRTGLGRASGRSGASMTASAAVPDVIQLFRHGHWLAGNQFRDQSPVHWISVMELARRRPLPSQKRHQRRATETNRRSGGV